MFAGTGKCNKNNILLAVVGLGYVGMPIAVEFDKRGVNVIGFDINPEKIENYKKGIDITEEVGNEVLNKSKVYFTSKEDELKKADFYIVAVPTPVNNDHTPDLSPVENASHIVGRNIKKNSIVVFGLPRNTGRLMGCLPAQVFYLIMSQSGGGRPLLPARLPWQPVALLRANRRSCI